MTVIPLTLIQLRLRESQTTLLPMQAKEMYLLQMKKADKKIETQGVHMQKRNICQLLHFSVYSHPSFFYCSMSDDNGSQLDVIRLSRHLLNRAASNCAISKQECMVLLSGLDLMMCSESIEMVSITGSYRLQDGASSTFYSHYEKRPQSLHHLSLDQYFDEEKNSNVPGKKTIIPHYVGGRSHTCLSTNRGLCPRDIAYSQAMAQRQHDNPYQN